MPLHAARHDRIFCLMFMKFGMVLTFVNEAEKFI